MTISELGALGELLGAVLTLGTLIYLAVQIRQNTAQQKREELTAIQHGQNSVLALLQNPQLMGAFARGCAGNNPSIDDRRVAVMWVLQYLNHFQIVHDLHKTRGLTEEQYQLWVGFAVAVVAPVHIRRWWDEEGGKFAFHTEVRDLIERRLHDTSNPPVALTDMWSVFRPQLDDRNVPGDEQ